MAEETFEGEYYCVKCKQKREAKGNVVVNDRGTKMAKGKCPVCGTNLNRILGRACRPSRPPGALTPARGAQANPGPPRRSGQSSPNRCPGCAGGWRGRLGTARQGHATWCL